MAKPTRCVSCHFLVFGCINNKKGRRKFVAVMPDATSYVVVEVHGGWLAALHGQRGGMRKAVNHYTDDSFQRCKDWCEEHANKRNRRPTRVK